MNAIQSNYAIPKISVLMPVYNGERYIREAVESVLDQTFGDFELLALDDGSTDKSAAILREYEARDGRVRVFSRENRGLVLTLNELIAKARGHYLARMDADDICLPPRFEKQLEFLDSHREYVLVGSFQEVINSSGQRIGVIRHPINHEEIDHLQLKGCCCLSHSSVMLRASAVKSLNGYDPQFAYAEDLELWLRMAEHGKIANIPEVLILYRIHEDSISESHQESQRNGWRLACEKAWARRGIEGRFQAVEAWRPGKDKASRHKFALQYGWVAWNHNYRDTWWAYAREALRLRPCAVSTWKLLIFGFLKTPPERTVTGK
jgi:glycosyltransferase involved in cell wall biosynthesis